MITYSQFVKENSKELAEKEIQNNHCIFCQLNGNSICEKANSCGSQNPTYLFVSDFMRKDWLKSGVPFSGQLLPILWEILKKVNIDINDCGFTTLVRCSSTKSLKRGKEVAPKKEIIDYCGRYLNEEILTKKPKVVIACGQTALEFFFPKAKLAEKRCQVLWSDKYNCNVVPIYNLDSMVVTSEFDDIILKALKQAYNVINNPSSIKFPETKYLSITNIELLRQVGERVKNVNRIAYDLETNGIVYRKAKILSVGVSWSKNTGVAWPLWVKDEEACNKALEGLSGSEKTKMSTKLDHDPILRKFWKDEEWDEVIRITKDIFENTTCKKGGHNTFFDNLVLHYNGIEVNNYCYDTMVMKHILDEEREKSLDYCSWIYTDKGGYKMEKEVYLKSDKSNFANIPLDVLLKYNAGDAAVTYELYDIFKPMIVEQNLSFEMGGIRIPLQKALMEACIKGMRVNRQYLRDTGKKLTEEIADIEKKILPILQKYYGNDVTIVSEKTDLKNANEFNINSAQNLRDLLFNKMKLKSSSMTASGEASTDESSLLKLARKGVEIAELILQRKKKFKFKTTYIDGMEDLLDEDDRVHPSFNVCGTTSGRLSCSGPNLQQIPQDKTIKNIFQAPEGYEIGEVDFSQAELRVMAALSNDTVMKRIYEQDRDLHMELAVSAFKKPESEITKSERKIAKCCNFLVSYGGGAKTLQANLVDAGVEVSIRDCEKMLKSWHDKFKDASSYLSGCQRRFLRDGLLISPWGRRRRMPRQLNDEYLLTEMARSGANAVIQGFAASLAFISLINISREVKKFGGSVISTVHDSILIEYPKENRKDIAKIAKQYTWVTYPELNGMYMKSDFECAESWGDKKPINMDTGEYVEE